MGLADTVTKAYMKENTVFADAFNYLIYGGKTVVDPALLQELDTTEIVLPFGAQDENGSQPEDAVQKYRDVLNQQSSSRTAKRLTSFWESKTKRISTMQCLFATLFMMRSSMASRSLI